MPIKKTPSYVSIINKRVTVQGTFMHPFKAKINLKCVSVQPNIKS